MAHINEFYSLTVKKEEALVFLGDLLLCPLLAKFFPQISLQMGKSTILGRAGIFFFSIFAISLNTVDVDEDFASKCNHYSPFQTSPTASREHSCKATDSSLTRVMENTQKLVKKP